MEGDRNRREKVSRTAASGVVALVFFILGFQVAIFSFKLIYKREGGVIDSAGQEQDGVLNERIVAGATEQPVGEGRSGRQFIPGAASGGGSSRSNSSASTSGSPRVRHRGQDGGPEKPSPRKESPSASSPQPFPFDPNTAGEQELQRLGFSPAQASSIVSYREKGHKFYSKEDFARMYVVSETMMARLDSFIMVKPLELNTADSAALTTLNGIGPYYASRIVAYRRSLGSFAVKEQLLEVHGIDRERYDGLKNSVCIDRGTVRHYRVCDLSDSALAANPYIGSYYASKVARWCRGAPDSARTVPAMARNNILPHANASRLSLYDTTGCGLLRTKNDKTL